MTQTIEHDATAALSAANLDWKCAVIQEPGAVQLRVETTHYAAAERGLATVGLVLTDVCHGGSITLARIVWAKVSKR